MINRLTTPFLLLCFLFLIACSKDDTAHPQATIKTLANTKWDLTTWGTGNGTESSIQPGEHVYFHFLDGENLKRINEEPCCPITTKEYTYLLRNDTLITNDRAYENYFKIVEHTSTKLALRNFQVVSLMTGEIYADPLATYTYIFKTASN